MDTVPNASEGLLLAMSQTIGLIRNLIGSANKKEALISSDDIEGLQELLAEEAETSCALRQKEKELKYRADYLCHTVGIPDNSAQLKKICSSVSDPTCRQQLMEYGNEMAEAVKQLNRQNAKLKDLLKYRIGYTDFMLNLLHSPESRLRSYNVQGMKEEGPGGYSLLDCHA